MASGQGLCRGSFIATALTLEISAHRPGALRPDYQLLRTDQLLRQPDFQAHQRLPGCHRAMISTDALR
jgi:hypothetical protein